MNTKILQTLKEIKTLQVEWDRLKQFSYFQSFEFNYTLLSATKRNPYVIAVIEHEHIIAIAPFFKDRNRLRFIGEPFADSNDILMLNEDARVLKAIAQICTRHNLKLEEVPKNSFAYGLLQHLPQWKSHKYFCNEVVYAPQKEVDTDKRDMVRRIKAIEKEGRLLTDRVQSGKKKAMNLIIKWHRKRWHKDYMPSMFDDDRIAETFRKLCEDDRMGLWLVYQNENPVAGMFGFYHGKAFFNFCHAYDLSINGIGNISQKLLLDNIGEVAYVDMGRGVEGYKLRFMQGIRHNYGIAYYTNPISNLLGSIIHKIKGSIIKNRRLHKQITETKRRLRW